MTDRRPFIRRCAVILVFAPLIWLACQVVLDGQLADSASSVTVRIRQQLWPHDIAGVFALPREGVPIEMIGVPNAGYTVAASGGHVSMVTDSQWVWQAPIVPGSYQITVNSSGGRREITLNAFVTVPADKVVRGQLNGYAIGRYPPASVKNDVPYVPPAGFVEVTRANENTLLSPHFRLKDFLCKEAGGYPKYVVIREDLLLKLESILTTLRTRGYAGPTLRLMSGYRTPAYNKAIGNVSYSMHLFGGAADIVVDADLNRDGVIDRADAFTLSQLVNAADPSGEREAGGLGIYGATPAHGPFVHVDVRPAPARWGFR